MKTIFLCAAIILSAFVDVLAQSYEGKADQKILKAIPGDSLYQDVVKWSRFEDHRTGTPADSATSQWLAKELGQVGYEVEFQEFDMPLFSFEEAELKVDGKPIACFPIWTPATTGEVPVSGPLVALKGEDSNPISYSGKLVLLNPAELTMKEFQGAMLAIEGGALGVIITYPHPAGVLAAVNCPAPFLDRQLPVPLVLVGQRHAERLTEMAAEQAQASIRIEGQFHPEDRARNLIARFDHGKEKWVVLSTPSSGWFQCVGERGTGVGVLLGLAKWAALQREDVNWMICITSGHELGHAGMMHLVHSEVLPEPGSTAAFVSLGASVAAREWEENSNTWEPLPILTRGLRLVASPQLAEHVRSSFEGLLPAKATDQPEGGELSHVMERGYPVIGMYGGHLWFHTIKDNLETTDAHLLGSVTHALAQSLDLTLADH